MTPSTGALALAAESYLEAGLCALPAIRNGDVKRPALGSWKAYQNHRPTFDEIRQSFERTNPCNSMCVVCGAVSQNLEMIDFDLAGEAFEPWKKLVEAKAPRLFDRLVIETSPSGGFHVVYRCDCVVSGNMKLAQRRIECDDAESLVVAAKSYMPRQDADGKWRILVTMIETRGEGGLFLCAPSPGYEIIQGDLRQPPVLTADGRAKGVAIEHPPVVRHTPRSHARRSRRGQAPRRDPHITKLDRRESTGQRAIRSAAAR